MRIGVISDTHIPRRAKSIPDEVIRGFEAVDLILHAGDLIQEEVIWMLEEIAPVKLVAGNCDSWDLENKYGSKKIIELDGLKIGLTHGHLGRQSNTVDRVLNSFAGVDCIVFGHSHHPYNQQHGDILLFNPGSPTDKRTYPYYSYGILNIVDKTIRGELFYY